MQKPYIIIIHVMWQSNFRSISVREGVKKNADMSINGGGVRMQNILKRKNMILKGCQVMLFFSILNLLICISKTDEKNT